MIKTLSVLLCALVAFGCATKPSIIESKRKVFHNWSPAQYAGAKFFVLPMDSAKAESMEFMTHAARLSIYFKDLGYKMLNQGESPDFIVWMDYSSQPIGTKTRHALSIVIKDKAKERAGHVGQVYECLVTSVVAIPDSAGVIPALIDSAMWDFPSKPGYVEEFSHHADFVDRVYRLNGPEDARK
jgi:hypothetical protein